MILSKTERKYIKPAVSYGWYMNQNVSTGKFFWDDDNCMPVSVGPICEKLIKKGLLERLDFGYGSERIRVTTLGATFKCPSGMCQSGRTYDDYGDNMQICELCGGFGVLENNEIRAAINHKEG